MYDFNNHPVWANNGSKAQPGFVDAGWTCGGVNPDHMNWWFNRTDVALLDLNERVETNTTDITNLTQVVNNLGDTFEANGILGVYVNNSSFSRSFSSRNSYTRLHTFTHTVQASGNVHLLVQAKVSPHLIPAPNSLSFCHGRIRLVVNNKVVVSTLQGHNRANNDNRLEQVFGQRVLQSYINALSTNPFSSFTAGDTITVYLEGQMTPQVTAGSSMDIGFPEISIIEYRATT